MIFTTHKEAIRVMETIADREVFEELTDDAMFVIKCMYECLAVAQDKYDEYVEEEYIREANAMEECIGDMMSTIAEVYVSLREDNTKELEWSETDD